MPTLFCCSITVLVDLQDDAIGTIVKAGLSITDLDVSNSGLITLTCNVTKAVASPVSVISLFPVLYILIIMVNLLAGHEYMYSIVKSYYTVLYMTVLTNCGIEKKTFIYTY